MKSREELRNDYEEALFAMIMDDIMELEGESLLAERERLQMSDEYRVPDDVNERCLKILEEGIEANAKRNMRGFTWKLCRTVFIAAVVMSLLVTSVCALVPEARGFIINVMRDITNGIVYFSVNPIDENVTSINQYYFGYLPDEFVLYETGTEDYLLWESYSSIELESRCIYLMVEYGKPSTVIGYDHEDCESEPIYISNLEGLLINKGDRWQAALYDKEHGNFIDVLFVDVDRETVLMILNEFKCR